MGENALFLGLILEKNLEQNNKRGNYSSQIRVTVSRSGGGGIDFSFTQISNNSSKRRHVFVNTPRVNRN